MTPKTAPYGSWKSPITSEMIVEEAVGLSQLQHEGTDLYWIEMRPSEGGRNVIVRFSSDGLQTDVTPPEFNARTRVHEYGGGDYVVHRGTVFFSNFADQRIYHQAPGAKPEPLTPACEDVDAPGAEPPCHWRYANGVVDADRERLLFVREDHSNHGRENVNTIVGVRFDGSDAEGRVLVAGNDFYSSPRLSPDGSRLAWLTWNHPNMPWDGSEVWVGERDS